MKSLLISMLLVIVSNLCYSSEKQQIINISPDIKLIQLSENFYIHESMNNSPQYGRFSSNGLLIIKNGKAMMIDTPFTNEETQIITDYLKDSMNVIVTTFIGGHFHDDCIGGMNYLKKIGTRCILGDLTRNKCVELNLPLPDFTFEKEHDFNFEGLKTECRYFGGGHSADNIVVYFPDAKILFGGCLIKSLQSNTIGNIQDASLSEWAPTVKKVKQAFPEIEIVVPGHGSYGNKELLDHTIDLVTPKAETEQ